MSFEFFENEIEASKIITPEFLDKLIKVVELHDPDDWCEMMKFIEWCYNVARKSVPHIKTYPYYNSGE